MNPPPPRPATSNVALKITCWLWFVSVIGFLGGWPAWIVLGAMALGFAMAGVMMVRAIWQLLFGPYGDD